MKLDKTMLMKVAIAAAVVLIVFLIFRSRSCKGKDGYAQFVASPVDDEYGENMYRADAADYAHATDDFAEEPQNYTLMESTLEDDRANAMFEPEL
jgi:hypothetical protein